MAQVEAKLDVFHVRERRAVCGGDLEAARKKKNTIISLHEISLNVGHRNVVIIWAMQTPLPAQFIEHVHGALSTCKSNFISEGKCVASPCSLCFGALPRVAPS